MKLHPRHWNSLSSEITLVFASLSIALVVLLCIISFRLNSRVLEERIQQELLLTVDQVLKGVNLELEERVREVHSLTLDPALREAAREISRLGDRPGPQPPLEDRIAASPGAAAAGRFLREMRESHPYLTEVLLTDRHGVTVAASGPLDDPRQNDEAWWHEAVKVKLHLSNLERDDSGQFGYSVALPILEGPGEPLGVVKAFFNLRGVQELANSVRIGNGGYLVVVSREGRVLSHPDAQHIFRQIGDVPDLVPVAATIAGSVRGVSAYRFRQGARGEQPWLVGYSRLMRPASLGPLNWTVAALVSRAEVVTPITSVRNRVILAGMVFILAAVPLVFAVSRRLSGPLVDLAQRADRISQGDLGVSLAIPSRNEIGRLASALGTMVENLKSSHRRTLDINAGLERTVRERTEEVQRKSRQIEAQNRKVMEASRLKSQFLANMSHELRTPLNAVLALSEILANETSGSLNEEQVKQVLLINRSGKSLLRLINDVLDLSKIEAGRMSVERAPMSLPSLMTLIADTLRPLAEDKRLSLTTNVAPGVPEFIRSDEHKLRQILINLVGNGIKFTEQGAVRLEVAFVEKPAMISFSIVDSGIGIAPDSCDRVFEEFFQADGSTTRKYGGTGLGLTISKKMAELMGGTLTVASTPGKGSTFTLAVPYEPSPPVPASAMETLRRVRMQVPEPSLMVTGDDSATALHDSRPIVLVAEDEQDNLYIMRKYINKLGCQAIFARDGNEVLAKARQYRPIAITLDLVLPKKNGWDVLSELKTDPETRNIPVIIASVLDNQERGFCLGAFRYLVKPINETDLADTVLLIQAANRKNVKRVLVIDDNVVDSDLMTRLLTENKYDVLRAARGEEGILTAARDRPDLIMLDLSMPGMDGYEVLAGLKSRPETREIPVVIYTAKDLTPEERDRLNHDAQRIFLKNPLEPSRMLAEIGELLRSLPGGLSTEAPEPSGAGSPPRADPWQQAAAAVQTVAEAMRASMPPGSSTAEATAASVEPSAPVLPAAPAGPAAARSGAAEKSILLVEDDPANQYTLEFLLRNEGYRVHLAENGREGIEKARELQPEIILMDMMMPVMGGHEATRTLKETPEVMEIPVIALTAAAMTGDREKALAAGCDDYVSKPINQQHLFERIEHWIARARAARRDGTRLRPPHPPEMLEVKREE